MMNSIKATHTIKDQNHQDESTFYWFDVTDTGTENHDGEYAVVHSGPFVTLVDCDGCPCNTDDNHMRIILEACVVTEEMINA